jgi:hypothetical protein
MIIKDLKLVTYNVPKVNYKNAKRLYILLLYMKSMLLTQELKVSWPYLLETLVKLSQKLENKLIKKLLSGEKKVELK